MNSNEAISGSAAPAEPSPATVLCVDDESSILSALRRLFRPAGYRVLLAGSGAEGLQMLAAEEGKVDLVISDMRMPEMDGARFLGEVRQHWPGVARILLTGYADITSTIAAINQGEISRYIAKPWNDGEVLLIVRDVLEHQALLGEKRRLEALTQRQNEELKDLNAGLEDKVKERTEELQRAHEKLKKSFLTSIQVFANLTELREGRMAGHSRRVADLARRIAREMNLAAMQVQDIFLAGLLHDIGKIGLPDHLLAKPVNQMTGEDLGAWRKHPLKGEQALMALEDLRNAAHLLRSHHERFDGKGFPDGLAGLAIPQGARILALANDYDGLREGGVTGRRMSEDEARQFIVQAKGHRYDPAVVEAFVALSGGQPEAQGSEMPLLPADLRPGMVLARDLISREGALLLAVDYVLDERVIRQIQDYERVDGGRVIIYVRPKKFG
jgi:response regulator RpfG family c-di-GMP phosphodiesterase